MSKIVVVGTKRDELLASMCASQMKLIQLWDELAELEADRLDAEVIDTTVLLQDLHQLEMQNMKGVWSGKKDGKTKSRA